MRTSTLTAEPRTKETWAAGHSSRRSMRILVIPREEAPPFFYYEPGKEPTEVQPTESADGSLRWGARLRGQMGRLGQGASDAEHRSPPWIRSPIRWLKARLPADERLLMGLRTAESVVLVHPTGMSGAEVLEHWWSYLNSRYRLRILSLVLYAVILAPSVLLTVIPGPHLIGIWVTYRLVAHGLALFGIVRCRRRSALVSTIATEALDGFLVHDRRETERVQQHFNLLGLKRRLKRERILARLRLREQRRAARVAENLEVDP